MSTLPEFSTELNAYLIPRFKDKILVLRRKNGIWEFPGGGVEFGEHPEKSSIRETMEETGLKASNLKLLGVTSATYKKDGKEKHSVYVVYSGDVEKDEFSISSEHEEGRWLTLVELEFLKLGFNAQDAVDFLKKTQACQQP